MPIYILDAEIVLGVLYRKGGNTQKGWSEQLPCRSAEVKVFSVFLCQRCREIWREIWVKFPRYVFQGLGARGTISQKFHAKNAVKSGKFHANFTLLGHSAEVGTLVSDSPATIVPAAAMELQVADSLRGARTPRRRLAREAQAASLSPTTSQRASFDWLSHHASSINGERKKPRNIKNFGGTPPSVRPVCPGDTSHLSRDMSRLSRRHSVPLVLIYT